MPRTDRRLAFLKPTWSELFFFFVWGLAAVIPFPENSFGSSTSEKSFVDLTLQFNGNYQDLLSTCHNDDPPQRVWLESLIGPLETEKWTPLEWSTLFHDGWDKPYDSVDHQLPRQTWINSADGAFYRLGVLSGSWAQGTAGTPDTSNGSLFLFTPLSRRFELGWFLPFSVTSPNTLGPPEATVRGVGDLTVAPRFMLAEEKHFSVTANLYVRCPTGNGTTGNGATSLSPDIEFWINPITRWIVRGAIGVTVPINLTSANTPLLLANPWTGFNASPSAFSSIDARLAAGYYLTSGDAPVFKHLCATVASNIHARTHGGNDTYFSLTPGFRFGVGNDWYLLGGIEVPVVGPLPFANQIIVQAIKNF